MRATPQRVQHPLLGRAEWGLAHASSSASSAPTGTVESCGCHTEACSVSCNSHSCGAQKPICHAAPAAGPFSTLNQLWAPAGGNGVQLPLGRYTAGEAAHQTLPALLGQVCAAWFRPCSVQPPVLQGAPLGSARCLQRRLACSSIPMHGEARHAQPALQSTIVTGGGCTWAAMSCSGHTGLAVDSA